MPNTQIMGDCQSNKLIFHLHNLHDYNLHDGANNSVSLEIILRTVLLLTESPYPYGNSEENANNTPKH